ncbi:unnamed protein product, partial [Polarella glacialis]
GGNVHPSTHQMRQSYGGPPVLVKVGPDRVWDRTGRCGLCVTRSLGDLSMHPFVIAVPEVTERTLSSKDKVLVLGSDGVFDRMDSQEAVDIAAKHSDPNVAAREITTICRQRWHEETGGQLSDDITAVVMHLDYSNPPGPGPPARGNQGTTPVSRGDRSGRFPDALQRRPSFGDSAAAKRLGSSQRLAAMESLRSTTAARLGLVAVPAAGAPSQRRRQ